MSEKKRKKSESQKKSAVALSYKPGDQDVAPVVAASGQGLAAQKIIEIAREHNIPVTEDSDLVSLLSTAEVGEEIPVEAFIAVAEILRYIYALKGGVPDAPIPTTTASQP